jgi:hypothetical protein
MKTQTKQKSLLSFLQAECANWDYFYQICVLTDKPCLVMEGRRCSYFEKSVLGPPGYIYKQPGYDYAKLFAQYAGQTGAETRRVQQRRCDCGTPLQHRQRYCEKCRRIRAKQAHCERQRKYRSLDSLNVTL